MSFAICACTGHPGLIIFVALNLTGYPPDFPLKYLSWFSNVVIGTYVGQRITRSSVRILRRRLSLRYRICWNEQFLLGGAALMLSDLPQSRHLSDRPRRHRRDTLLAIALSADVANHSPVVRLLNASWPPVLPEMDRQAENRRGLSPCDGGADSMQKTIPAGTGRKHNGTFFFWLLQPLPGPLPATCSASWAFNRRHDRSCRPKPGLEGTASDANKPETTAQIGIGIILLQIPPTPFPVPPWPSHCSDNGGKLSASFLLDACFIK